MSKGDDTKRAILAAGLDMASRIGLERVTIGGLAKEAGLSKSGLYAHFQSKEALQIDILQYAGQLFAGSVLIPALQSPAGIPRIQALVQHWNGWNARLSGGCIFISASNGFKNTPGKVRDFLVAQQQEWLGSLQRLAQSAIDCGDFRKDADTEQFAFELYSFLLGFHLFYKMIKSDNPEARQEHALERLIDTYR
jgi:AcrR family transcriptional regulator